MLNTTQKAQLKELLGDEVEFDLPLGPFTNIRIGGPADALVWPKDAETLQRVVGWARENKLSMFVLGKGSNTLIRDGGFRGVVINLTKAFRHFGLEREEGASVWVRADGGVPTQQFVRWCADQGFSGAERLAGIPGTLGGNVFMNAGTALGEIGELVEEVTVCDARGKIQRLPKEKLRFDYRYSNIPPSSVVLSAALKLKKGDKEAIEKIIRDIFEKRGMAQPIEMPNLGSIFKNPGAREDLALPVRTRGARGDGVPAERSEVGQRSPRSQQKKAWELVEEAACRGVRVGHARVSEKHANFIVNEGGATAKDVLILIGLIKDKVKEASGILLETEIKVVGE